MTLDYEKLLQPYFGYLILSLTIYATEIARS